MLPEEKGQLISSIMTVAKEKAEQKNKELAQRGEAQESIDLGAMLFKLAFMDDEDVINIHDKII